jgi:hypothetical protein
MKRSSKPEKAQDPDVDRQRKLHFKKKKRSNSEPRINLKNIKSITDLDEYDEYDY